MVFQPGNSLGRRHGWYGTPTYKTWSEMIQRCTNPNHKDHPRYGSLGVCDRWLRFENFLADMGERPAGLTLERRKNDEGYSPTNCEWATKAVQMRNRRNTNWVTYAGETLCVTDWAAREGVTRAAIRQRVAVNGIPVRTLKGM